MTDKPLDCAGVSLAGGVGKSDYMESDYMETDIKKLDAWLDGRPKRRESAGEMYDRLGTDGSLWAFEMAMAFELYPSDLLGWCCAMIERGRDAGYAQAMREVAMNRGPG